MFDLLVAVLTIAIWFFFSRMFFRAGRAVITMACKMDHSHGAAHSFTCWCECHKPRA